MALCRSSSDDGAFGITPLAERRPLLAGDPRSDAGSENSLIPSHPCRLDGHLPEPEEEGNELLILGPRRRRLSSSSLLPPLALPPDEKDARSCSALAMYFFTRGPMLLPWTCFFLLPPPPPPVSALVLVAVAASLRLHAPAPAPEKRSASLCLLFVHWRRWRSSPVAVAVLVLELAMWPRSLLARSTRPRDMSIGSPPPRVARRGGRGDLVASCRRTLGGGGDQAIRGC